MARTKGAKNKQTAQLPEFCSLDPTERLQLLANLMVDRILEDQANNKKLLRKIKRQTNARLSYN